MMAAPQLRQCVTDLEHGVAEDEARSLLQGTKSMVMDEDEGTVEVRSNRSHTLTQTASDDE